jgi:hypothetical protein
MMYKEERKEQRLIKSIRKMKLVKVLILEHTSQ